MISAAAEGTCGFRCCFLYIGRVFAGAIAICILVIAIVAPLVWPQQVWFAVLLLGLSLCVHKISESHRTTLFLMLLSCVASLRYATWRLHTVRFAMQPAGACPAAVDTVLMLLLLGAEGYFILGMALGYFQALMPLGRMPAALPDDLDLWPEVDLLITTLSEPLDVVKYAALAAVNIDWPADRLNVYVMDDSRREEIRAFCAQAGVGYMVRDSLEHVHAGSINQALKRVDAPFVAVFDADQVPTRSFLQITMGWFLRDAKIALVQTPHHQYSAAAFEQKFGQFQVFPAERKLYYGVVQDGNDLWNATSFCGSCAVLRRAALDEIGDIAAGTLTEDAHTSVRLQRRGWNTAYINISQAACMAPLLLSGHVRQRMRMARGMVQVLRKENPLFARGLSLPQRICYFHASMQFFYPLPRLVCLLAPLMLLVFGRSALPGAWGEILAYALPHLILSYVITARMQGSHRYSFWNEIYEMVLSLCLLGPTLLAFLWPAGDRFSVTPRNDIVQRSFFDLQFGWPFLALFVFSLMGLIFAVLRLLPGLHQSVWVWPVRTLHFHPFSAGVIAINAGWAFFNLVLLSVAIGVASESRQRRRAVRFARTVRATLSLQNGIALAGSTADLSSGGALFVAEGATRVNRGELVIFVLGTSRGQARIPATVIGASGSELRLSFDTMATRDEELLATLLYSRADAWVTSEPQRDGVGLLRSLFGILLLGIRGVSQFLGHAFHRSLMRSSVRAGLGVILVLGWVLLVGRAESRWSMQSVSLVYRSARSTSASIFSTIPSNEERVVLFKELSSPGRLIVAGPAWKSAVSFTLPETQVVRTATLRVGYGVRLDEGARGRYLSVSLNGVEMGKLWLDGDETDVERTSEQIEELSIPAELLVHNNLLEFRLRAATGDVCNAATCGGVSVMLNGESSLQLTVRPLIPAGSAQKDRGAAVTGSMSKDAFVMRRIFARLESPWSRVLEVALSCFVLSRMLHTALLGIARDRLDGVPRRSTDAS